MARFQGIVQGNRSEASRLGSPKSGLWVIARGWNIGVYVTCFVNEKGKDEIEVWKTGGSNNPNTEKLIANFEEK